jgi:hypothetical protein
MHLRKLTNWLKHLKEFGIVTKLQTGRQRNRGSITGNDKRFSLLQKVQIAYTMGTGGEATSHGVKADRFVSPNARLLTL